MFKKKLVVSAMMMSAAMFASNALAITLEAGTLKFVISNFDAGTTGYPTGSPTPAIVCNSVADCDSKATTPAPYGIGSEDSWGIFDVTKIERQDGSTVWAPSAGEELTGMFYGLDDYQVTYLGKDFDGNDVWQALSVGGFLDLYLDTSPDYTAGSGPSVRGGLSSYPTVTDGSLFLALQFKPSPSAGNFTATYKNRFDNGTVAGSGSGYLDVIGGSAASRFDTNSVYDPNGNPHDFTFDVTFNNTDAVNGWTVRSTGQALGYAVPEPATLALLGIGLLGIGGFGRRKI